MAKSKGKWIFFQPRINYWITTGPNWSKVDNTFHWKNLYPVDNAFVFPNTYRLDAIHRLNDCGLIYNFDLSCFVPCSQLQSSFCLWIIWSYKFSIWFLAWKYSEDFPASSSTRRKVHSRSATEPMSFSQSYRPSSPSRTLSYALDDLNISSNSWKNFSDPVLRFKSRYSPNLRAALGASDRIQQRVERVIDKKSPRTFVSVKINILTYFCNKTLKW